MVRLEEKISLVVRGEVPHAQAVIMALMQHLLQRTEASLDRSPTPAPASLPRCPSPVNLSPPRASSPGFLIPRSADGYDLDTQHTLESLIDPTGLLAPAEMRLDTDEGITAVPTVSSAAGKKKKGKKGK